MKKDIDGLKSIYCEMGDTLCLEIQCVFELIVGEIVVKCTNKRCTACVATSLNVVMDKRRVEKGREICTKRQIETESKISSENER